MFDEKDITSKYTIQEAVDDGVLITTGLIKIGLDEIPVRFTHNLLFEGFEKDLNKRKKLIEKGIKLLNKPNSEDTHFKLRVIEKDKIWVVADLEQVLFLKPEDY